MAGVQTLCLKATPATRSGCSEGRLPNRYRSACMFRSGHIVELRIDYRGRCRRRCSFTCQDRPLVVRILRHCYQLLQSRYRSNSSVVQGTPLGQWHKRTPHPTGIFSTEWRFSLPTRHAGTPAAYFRIAGLPAVQLPGGRVWLLR